jgi:hypothetical protein
VTNTQLEVDPEMLFGILQQYMQQQWTGTIEVKSAMGVKTLGLFHGEIAFARSSLLDDRLGEVLYRNGTLGLSKLRHFGTLVSDSQRFGQILLSLHSFDQQQLWQALCTQVRHIVASLFYLPKVSLSIKAEPIAETTMISLEESGELFLASSYVQGVVLRQFIARLLPTASLKVFAGRLEKTNAQPQSMEDSFVGDFLNLAQQHPRIVDLVSNCKLPQLYTYAQIFKYWHQGLLSIEGLPVQEITVKAHLLPLKQQIQAYNLVSQTAQQQTVLAGKTFPREQLNNLSQSLAIFAGFPQLLGESGQLHAESAALLYGLGEIAPSNLPSLLKAVRTLELFTLQVTSDLVGPTLFAKVRAVFMQYSSV